MHLTSTKSMISAVLFDRDDTLTDCVAAIGRQRLPFVACTHTHFGA